MTPDQTIAANDRLRNCFSGGRVEVCHGPYDIDDRTLGRMLCALARYNSFPPESLHDEGVIIFAGFHVAWMIGIVDGERVMRVWINDDVLQSARAMSVYGPITDIRAAPADRRLVPIAS